MIKSLNSNVDLTIAGNSFLGLGSYGKIMVGNRAFEFYNDRNINDFIQIPWEEVDYIAASVMFKGKYISRFVIFTKKNGKYSFSSKNNKKLLRAVNKYIDSKRLVKSDTFFSVISKGLKSLLRKK